MFDSLGTWRGHEMEHRRKWSCPLCSASCKEESTTQAHLIQCHGDVVGPHNLKTLLKTSSHPAEFLLASDCPFCDWNAILRRKNCASEGTQMSVPAKRFLKHLSKHLEEIALFVVPQPEQDDEGLDQLGSNAVHAAEADDDTAMSTLSSFGSRTAVHAAEADDDTAMSTLSSFGSTTAVCDEVVRSEGSNLQTPNDLIMSFDPAQGYIDPRLLGLPAPISSGAAGSHSPVLPRAQYPQQGAETGEEPGPKTIADPSSQQSPTALAHEMISQEESRIQSLEKRRHPCDYDGCTMAFRSPKDLRRHKMIHGRSGAQDPYICPKGSCSKSFHRKDNLTRHMRSAHSDKT